MRYILRLCVCLLTLTGSLWCSGATEPAQPPTVSLPPELARVLTDYERAWSTGNSVALAQLFAEDGFVLANGSPIVRGRAAIARFYVGSGKPLSLRAVAFATEGNLGWIVGEFGDRPGGPDRGKFTLTLRRHPSGRWLITSDMDNGNARPAAAAQ